MAGLTENHTNHVIVRILALCRFGKVSPRLFAHLLHRYRSVDAIMRASRESLAESEGLTEEAIGRICSCRDRIHEAAETQRELAKREISLISLFDEKYPRQFEELNDPPPILYVRGKVPERSGRTVAIVGNDKASNEGMELTSQLVKRMARDRVQFVSSLVGGIDTAAHLTAGSCGVPSFAVLEYGFDHLHGTDFVTMGIDISRNGGVISEYSPERERETSHLSETNRLIAGMGDAVVVTELSDDSERMFDMFEFCGQIGKLTFVVTDRSVALNRCEQALKHALSNGAIPIESLDSVDEITRSLV